MSASISVGFTPVAPGTGVITGASTAAAAPEADSPLGFLDALLDMLTLAVPPVDAVADQAALPTDALGDLGLGVSAEIGADPVLPEIAPAAPVAAPVDQKDVLNDLVKALAALDQAVADGKPVDPALKKKLTETLDALAGILGIQLPTQPAIDPAITAAAQIDGSVTPELDPLLELARAATPTAPTDTAPDTIPVPAATPDAAAPDAEPVLAAAPVADPASDVKYALPADAVLRPLLATPVDASSPLGKLAQKLDDLAKALSAQSPELSKKLEAVAKKVAAGEVDADALAKLSTDTQLDAADLDALLTPKTEAKPAPTAPMFTAPALPMPEVVAAPAKQKAEPAPALIAEPAAPVDAPEADPVLKPTLDTKPADVEKPADAPAAARGSFAAALSEAKADQPANQQTAPVQTAQVKTELGIVAPKTVHAAYQAPVQQVNLPQVAFEVVRHIQQGSSRFQIRLDPPELGRIDVKMSVDGDGNVQARMTVERAETLDLMQRDQRSLERALQQAGLDSSKTNLEFSLRQNPFAREEANQGRGGNGSPYSGGRGDSNGEETPEVVTPNLYRGSASASGVNLFV